MPASLLRFRSRRKKQCKSFATFEVLTVLRAHYLTLSTICSRCSLPFMTPARRSADAILARNESLHDWPHEPLGRSAAHEAWRVFFLFLQDVKESFPALAAEF